MDSPNSPDSNDQAATPQTSQTELQNGASSSSNADVKPSQTSSILKERRFKLSRCALSAPTRAMRRARTGLTEGL